MNFYDEISQDDVKLIGENNSLSQQLETMGTHHDSLRQHLDERENTIHETETKLNSLEQTSSKSNQENASLNIEELINKRFDKLDQSIDEIIEKKLACRAPQLTEPISIDPGNDTTTTSFATVAATSVPAIPVTAGKDLVSALKRSRNAELVAEQERQKRENNIIIYGIEETLASESVTLNVQDKEFISSFLDSIEVDVVPKHAIRLGKENTQSNRPVKVVLNNTDDKRKIMSNLNKLKNAEQSFRCLSVRDDYTIEERELIKTFTEEAKRKNEEGSTTVWKVRGTPKNGLRVVKITTRKLI